MTEDDVAYHLVGLYRRWAPTSGVLKCTGPWPCGTLADPVPSSAVALPESLVLVCRMHG